MALDISHPDFWTRALQFTPTIHRDVYPAIAPESDRAHQAANGKVVVVTGAGSGFGKVCFDIYLYDFQVILPLMHVARGHAYNGLNLERGRLCLPDDGGSSLTKLWLR